MDIQKNIDQIKLEIPGDVTLVAVSKNKSVEEIMKAYQAGQRIFGENKIQEMVSKSEQLPKDIQWHMIGHTQTNKVKYMTPFVSLVHAADSEKLIKELDKQAMKHNRIIKCLIQVRIAAEKTKFGVAPQQVEALLAKSQPFNNVRVIGLMGMASLTPDINQIRREFQNLSHLYQKLKYKYPQLTTLSMGMSDDFNHAIEFGSNMIRVGSRIFGKRKVS